jgi:hypothetical protein
MSEFDKLVDANERLLHSRLLAIVQNEPEDLAVLNETAVSGVQNASEPKKEELRTIETKLKKEEKKGRGIKDDKKS